jgi:hypothetical protein
VGLSLFASRQRQELRREIATDIALECQKAREPEGVEDREQQQRIFERLSQRFRLLDQHTCLLCSRLGFGGMLNGSNDVYPSNLLSLS